MANKVGATVRKKKTSKAAPHIARWLCTFSLALLALVVFLPSLVNWQVNKILRNLMVNGVAEFRLIHAGLFRSDIAMTFLDDPVGNSTPVQIDSCILDYRPLRLLAGQIDSVRLNGVSLLAVVTNGTLRIPAVEMFAQDIAPNAKPPTQFSIRSLQNMPVSVGSFRMQGTVILDAGVERIAMPINLHASSSGTSPWESIVVDADTTMSTSRVSLNLTCDTRSEKISAKLNGIVSTDSLPYFIRRELPEVLRRATGDFKATANLSLNHASLKSIDLSATANTWIETSFGVVDLHPEFTATGDDKVLKVSLTGLKTTRAGFTASFEATNLVCNLAKKTLDGSVHLGLSDNTPLVVDVHLDPLSFQVALAEKSKPWGCTLKIGDLTLDGIGARLNAAGKITPASDTFLFSSDFGFDKLEVRDAEGGLVASIGSGLAGLATLERAGKHFHSNTSLQWDDAAMPKQQLNIRNVSLGVSSDSSSNGALSVSATARAEAAFRNVEVVKFCAGLRQTATDAFLIEGTVNALGVEGRFGSLIDPAAQGGTTISNTFQLVEQTLDLGILPKLVPGLDDFAFGGKVSASADYLIEPQSQRGSFKFRFSDGTLNYPSQKLSASDIRMTFEMPYLPSLASNSQLFSFKNLKAGNFFIESGLAIFRMQSPAVWYLDKLILDWCGGKVRGESTRISRGNKNTWVTLHADQLELSKLLLQCGIGTDTGESGKLSGTIPVIITGGKVTVKNGYFYSTPGKTGTVRLLPTQMIVETAAASIETSLALDALSEFTYSWIRLGLNSEGDDLMMKFEMDGRPSHKLFYSVTKDGEIVKSHNASDFTGIVLDTNFRIPLNKLISLAKPLATIMKASDVE